MLVIAAGILGFAGIVLLAALLLVGIEAGSELVRDLKRDPGLKIALRARSSVAVIQPAIGPWSHDPDGGDEPLLLLRAHGALCPRRATRRAALRRTGRQ